MTWNDVAGYLRKKDRKDFINHSLHKRTTRAYHRYAVSSLIVRQARVDIYRVPWATNDYCTSIAL